MNISKHCPEWLLIKAWLKTKIDEAHSNMEAGLGAEEYHFSRGHIALAKALIEEVEPTRPPTTTEDDYGISATPE